MSLVVSLSAEAIKTLDLAPGHDLVHRILENPRLAAQQVEWLIDYPRSVEDPRELPEIPEVRLWFVRFDAVYPWMPFFLNWRVGELARYTAMLVPHQFTAKEGIVFNSEALEIFVYSKIFVLLQWLRHHQLGSVADLRNMALVFGYEISDEFLQLWQRQDLI